MTAETRRSDAGTRFLVAAASLVIVIAGLRAAATLIMPFLIAVFLAIVSVPLMTWLQRKGVPKALAVICTMLMAVGIIAIMVVVVGRSVNSFTDAVPRYQERLQDLIASATEVAAGLGVPIEDVGAFDLLPTGVFNVVGTALSALTAFASSSFLVLLTVIFILFEAAGFRTKLRVAFGDAADFGQLSHMTQQVQHYLVIKTAISVGTGLVVGTWVWVWGLDFALLWGLVAFILNFIPNLGSIIAAVPAVLLAIIQLGPGRAAVIALGYLGVNIIFGNFLEPTLMGRRLGLSTLVVFVSLVFWGFVWGPIGMLFSVPLTMVMKIALENTQEFRWVAVMLDANPAARQARPESGD